jgi:GTP-binding protein HflX
MWDHLDRIKGGIGMKGAGETEIETDRRIVRDRIALLKERLKTIDRQMETQRKSRGEMIRVALVGYTNVGKSTIMNMLSKSDVFAENKLFATLDTTVRKVVVGNLPFLLSDTVGFIRKLPTQLVESFKSTLDETREADILLHVVDISHPGFEDQLNVVKTTLTEIGAGDKRTILVFNKIDAYREPPKEEHLLDPTKSQVLTLKELEKSWMSKINNPCIFISATDKENIDSFRALIFDEVKAIHTKRYPYDKLEYWGG